MSGTGTSIAEDLEDFERRVATFGGQLKRVGARLGKARKVLASRPSSIEVEKLLKVLEPFAKAASPPSVPELVSALQKHLAVLRGGLANSFIDALRSLAHDEQLYFHQIGDDFAIGPFLLSLDAAKEQAKLSYAKSDIARLNLVPAECLKVVKQLKAEIVDQPIDLAGLRNQLQEALRVVAARKGKSLTGELRAELPQVYREVGFMRQSDSSRPAATLSLPRFVVELSSFIQSDSNIDSEKPLRLETAVLDNTKNHRKSTFIPKDLSQGFGEGTYFQALIGPAS